MYFSQGGLAHLIKHQKTTSVGNKIHPVLADLSKVPLAENSFNLIVVIRYLDRNAIENYLTALKPDGYLFFKAFNTNHLKNKPNFNSDYLLRHGELVERFIGQEIIFSNDCPENQEAESVILLKKSTQINY